MRTNILSWNKTCVFIQFIFLVHTSNAQCYNSTWENATVFTVDNTIGVYDFTFPSNAEVSDNSRAAAASLISILSGNTYYLKATGFNFNIPSYASICGVNVQIESRATGLLLTAAVRDNEIKLIKNGTITGNNKASGADWGSTDAYSSYGGSNDLWGTTLTPADVNSANFGIAISVRLIALVAALPSAQIDHIRMQVVYNPILPVSLAWFNAENKNGAIQLNWKTTEEEDGAVIIVERSFNNAGWTEIQRYQLSTRNVNKEYRYTDPINADGEVQYRLCTILPSGLKTYSLTKRVTTVSQSHLLIYPNPAKNKFTSNAGDLTVTDILGRQWKLPVTNSGGSYSATVEHLPPGIYNIYSSKGAVKLVKE